ncbi:MAG: O-antigen polysaccharide polymerase Wzy [Lachnospiraceae bacterium]|nr:O-antigen polysaccharide polymerase Wzy [Lachnospiraceae bacterium]MCM1237856.1 O-antigen polysaccharide polymerase Wzy [Lachnospiraceae bacterium]
MEKISPYKCLIVAQIAYWFLFFMGPYKHTVYDYEGLIYVLVVFVFFIMSCYIGERTGKMKKKERYIVTISKSAEIMLLLVEAVSVFAFVIYMWEVIHLPVPGGYQFAVADYRNILSANRSIINKIAEVAMYLGTVAYLILSRVPRLNYRITRVVSVGALFLPAIAILGVGGRSRVVTSVGLFMIIVVLNHYQSVQEKIKMKRKQWGRILICIVIIGILGYFTLSLFSTRGEHTAPEQYLFYPGDVTLRPVYGKIYSATHGMVNPLYKASLYFTHSIPVFTKTYSEFWSTPKYYGALLFFLEGYILRAIGIPFPEYLKITALNPAAERYSTFISGYIMDWGIVGTLFMVVITGLLFGRIAKSAYKKKAGYYLMPVIIFMCMVSPIYYFWHMGWEYVLLFFPAVYFLSRKFGLRAERQENDE